jgi:hypothetical protein
LGNLRRSQSDGARFKNRQPSGELIQNIRLLKELLDQEPYERCRGMARQAHNYDSGVLDWIVVANVGEAEVPSKKTRTLYLCERRDFRILGSTQAQQPDMCCIMSKLLRQFDERTREISVDQKTHEGAYVTGNGWWVSSSTRRAA